VCINRTPQEWVVSQASRNTLALVLLSKGVLRQFLSPFGANLLTALVRTGKLELVRFVIELQTGDKQRILRQRDNRAETAVLVAASQI